MKIHLLFVILFILIACSEDVNEKEPGASDRISEDPADVELYDYGDELGLELETPKQEAATTLSLEGEVEQADALNEDFVWAQVRKKETIDEIEENSMDYFIPLEDGSFAEEVNLHHGAGEYDVTIMLPSEEKGEDEQYFDAATFDVKNIDKAVEREVELSKYGAEKGLEIEDSITGWNTAEETFEVAGNVGDDYAGDKIYAEVEKDGEHNQLVFPVEKGQFSGEVPLNYGEGVHKLDLQLESDEEGDEDGTYYESATLYVDNESDKEFPEFTEYDDYTDSGLVLEE